MLRDLRLLKDDAFLRVEPDRQVVRGDFDHVLRHAARVRVVAGQRVPVGDEVEAVVGRIVLQAHPVLQRAEVVADMQPAGGPHAANDAFTPSAFREGLFFRFRSVCQSLSLEILECGGLAAAFYGVVSARPRAPFDTAPDAYTVKAGARLPHSKVAQAEARATGTRSSAPLQRLVTSANRAR